MNASRRVREFAAQVSSEWVSIRLAAQGLELLGWVFLARSFAAADVGELAVALLILRFLGLVADWGAPFGGVRLVARQGASSEIAGLILGRRRLTAGVGTVAVVTLLWIEPELFPLVGVLLYRGANQDWIALGRGLRARAALPPLIGGAGFVLAAVAGGTTGRFALLVGGFQIAALGTSLAMNRVVTAAASIGPALRDGKWIAIVMIADQIYQSSDVLFLGALAGAADAGIYAVLYRIPAGWIAIVGLLSAGWLRTAVENTTTLGRATRTDPRTLLVRSGTVAAIFLPLAGLTAWFAIPTILGAEFAPHRDVALALIGVAAVATVTGPLSVAFMASRPDRLLAIATVATAAGNLVGNYFFIRAWGMMGAAVATLLAFSCLALFFWWQLD